MADTVNSYAVGLLVLSLVGLGLSLRLAWRMWRIGFKSPALLILDRINHDLARDRARRRREQ